VGPGPDEEVVHRIKSLPIVQGCFRHRDGAGRAFVEQDFRHQPGQIIYLEWEQAAVPTSRIRIHSDRRRTVRPARGGSSYAFQLAAFFDPDAPARPKEASGYLPVHDIPPERDEQAMKPADQAKLEAELVAARARQASTAAQNAAAK